MADWHPPSQTPDSPHVLANTGYSGEQELFEIWASLGAELWVTDGTHKPQESEDLLRKSLCLNVLANHPLNAATAQCSKHLSSLE